MRPLRVTANLRVPDIEAAKHFYTEFLGLGTEEFNMGWVARYTSRETGACVQLVTRDASSPQDSVISVHADDVDGAYEEARRAYEIAIGLERDPAVRRFLLRRQSALPA